MFTEPPSANDQLVIEFTKFLPADKPLKSSSKLLLPMYCVPPPTVDNEPDFTSTLLVPPASFIFKPGSVLLNSTVLFAFLKIESVNTNPPILPPVNSTCEPLISPFDFTLNAALPLFVKEDAPAKNLVSPVDDNPVKVGKKHLQVTLPSFHVIPYYLH